MLEIVALDVAVSGLPIGRRRAVGDQYGICREKAGRFHVDDELRSLVDRRNIARQHDADLVGEDLMTVIGNDTAAIAVAVEREADVGSRRENLGRNRMKHLHVFGVRVVVRESVVEVGVERHDLAADRFQDLRREGTGRAVAAGGDDLEAALELRTVGQSLDVALGDVRYEDIAAARFRLELAAENDRFQFRHVVGSERQRPRQSHLDTGPAIVVVARRHHRDAFDVEVELREVGHRRKREADVVNLAAACEQARHERLLHSSRIRAIIVTDDDALRNAAAREERRHAEPDRVETHQVDFFRIKPARIVFAKAGRLDERQALEVSGIRLQVSAWLRQHKPLLERCSFGELNALKAARGSDAPLYQQCYGRKSVMRTKVEQLLLQHQRAAAHLDPGQPPEK